MLARQIHAIILLTLILSHPSAFAHGLGGTGTFYVLLMMLLWLVGLMMIIFSRATIKRKLISAALLFSGFLALLAVSFPMDYFGVKLKSGSAAEMIFILVIFCLNLFAFIFAVRYWKQSEDC
jgi:hypothetical protein